MRIVHVIARLNIGGPAVHVGLVCEGMRRRGHQAWLAAGRVVPPEGDMAYSVLGRGVEPIYVDSLGRSLNPLSDAASIAALARLFARLKPDVVHTHTSKAGVVGRLAARLARVPGVVHTFHGHVLHGYFHPVANLAIRVVERGMARLTDRIVVLGGSQRSELLSEGIGRPDQVQVVRFGMDLEPFTHAAERRAAARAAFGLEPGGPVIGIVGRLTRIKGHEHFLAMASLLERRMPQARFLIVGDGELRTELEQSLRRLGLESKTRMAGWRQDMVEVYAALDALALTSLNEGSPVVLKEAMAAGVPCAAHRVGGVPDLIVHGESGFLSEPGDAKALAANVTRCVTPCADLDALVARARGHVLSQFGAEPMFDALERIYSEVCEEATGPRAPST